MHKVIYENDSRFNGFFDKYEIGFENPAAFSLSTISQAIHLTFDLKLKILINGTNQGFVTSDNPVIAYNQFLEKRKQHGGITGLGVKGVQYFLPIDEKSCLLFYDDAIYNIGHFFKNKVFIKSRKDIDSINTMQVLNSTDNVYFSDNTEYDYITDIYNRSLDYEKPGINKVKKYFPTDNQTEDNSCLIHSYATDMKINLELSFIKETSAAKNYDMGNKSVHVRNEKIFNTLNK